MRTRACRVLECDAGHRVTQHESKCRSVHGHRYRFEVVIESEELDSAGRTIDFGILKSLVGGWVDDNLDHAYVHKDTDYVGAFVAGEGHKTYEMPDGREPTAECLARLVYDVAVVLISAWVREDSARDALGLLVVEVKCWETPNCYALYPVR